MLHERESPSQTGVGNTCAHNLLRPNVIRLSGGKAIRQKAYIHIYRSWYMASWQVIQQEPASNYFLSARTAMCHPIAQCANRASIVNPFSLYSAQCKVLSH